MTSMMATVRADRAAAAPAADFEPPIVDAILALVRARTGTDFSHYRAAMIRRRILNRMISAEVSSLEQYLALVRTCEAEIPLLVERLTIKVSRFYRNSATFDMLRTQVIPELAKQRGGRPLRIWSAGCGCGEEAYTLAMLLDEAACDGIVAASDIDPAALETARDAVYPQVAAAELPPDLAARYLDPAQARQQAGYRVRDSLRTRVRFSRHDLTSAAPAPGGGAYDLVSCRNVLIYLERSMSARVLCLLRRSVAGGGYLCLGEAEWPADPVAASLDTLDHRTRVFRAKDDTDALKPQ